MAASRTNTPPTTAITAVPDSDAGLRAFMLGVYNRLALGLVLASGLAWVVGNVPQVGQLMFRTVAGQPVGYTLLGMGVVFAPLVLLLGAGFVMRTPTARGTGVLYWSIVALMGASLGVVFLIYTGASLARTFLITAAAFGSLSLWGYTTKRSLSGAGSFLMMSLIGLILASVVNIFLRSSALAFVVDIVGVLIFSGLIAWDTQRLKLSYADLAAKGTPLEVAANYGALSLFINFINLFQFLLLLTGQRQR